MALYLKGSTSGLLSGNLSKNIQKYYNTKEHHDLMHWLEQFASTTEIENIVWDGDVLHRESYTQLLFSLKKLLPKAVINACKLQPNSSLQSQFHAKLGANFHVITENNKKKLPKYVHLGVAAIKKFGAGSIIVIGGGPVVWQEFVESLSLKVSLSWYCIEINGWSSITQQEKNNHPVFKSNSINSTADLIEYIGVPGRLYQIN